MKTEAINRTLPSPPRVADRIRRVALLQPGSPAIEHQGRVFTYAELVRSAEDGAARLSSRGVAPGDVVAVTGPRNFELVTQWLGAWQIGAVVLPLDPALPRSRQEAMARAAGVRMTLDSAGEADLVEAGLSRDAPERLRDPEIACIFFTSGSTGEPKGILGRHSAIAHFLEWQGREFHVGPGDRVAQLTGLSFDVVLRDLFLPLTTGATVCLPPHDLDAADPGAWLQANGVTRLHTVPSLARLWLQARESDHLRLESLRTTFFAGEPLDASLVNAWRRTAPNSEVINLYGPTETTMAKCWYRVPDTPADGTQPIGAPIPDTEILLFADSGELCATDEIGEIVIRTPYRSAGYLDESRAPAFRPDPTSADPDDLVYFTGDLGRRRADGVLEIVGRKDDQVKIMGNRVEPREIAAILERHPDVRRAHVIARKADPPQLIACFQVRDGHIPRSELVRHLIQHLPPAMIPVEFHQVEHFPLTANGKLDRDALRQLGPTPQSESHGDVEPGIARAWTSVLGRPPASAAENFFATGAHSLAAARLAANLRDETGVEVGIRDIFDHPTPAAQSRLIAGSRSAHSDFAAADNDDGPQPVTSAQRRFLLANRILDDTPQPVETAWIRLVGPLDTDRLRSAWTRLHDRHEALRTRFLNATDGFLQVVEPRATPDFRMPGDHHFSCNPQEAAAALAAEPFELDRAPLIRCALIPLAPNEHALVYAAHHAIWDGASHGILLDDLRRLYAGERLPPPPRDTPTVWAGLEQSSWAAALQRQVRNTARRLRDAPTRLDLPADRPRRAHGAFNRNAREVLLEADTWRRLNRTAERDGATPFVRVLTSWARVLHRITGQDDLLIASPVSLRPLRRFERNIGCHINTLLIRSTARGQTSLEDWTTRMRDEVLRALADAEAPFDQVVAELRPTREAGAHPLAQVMFNGVLADEPPACAGGMEWHPSVGADSPTPFDLVAYAREKNDTLSLRVVYDAHRFDTDRAEGWLAMWREEIRRAAEHPGKPFHVEANAAAHPPDSATLEEEAAEESDDLVEALAEIWRDTLKVTNPAPRENFFALGGHSLLAVKLMARIRDHFGIALPLRTIFEYPTLAEMAACIRSGRAAEWPPIQRGDFHELSTDQVHLWDLHASGRDEHWYNVTRAFRLDGPLDTELLRVSINRVVQRHAILRSVYEPGPCVRARSVESVPLHETCETEDNVIRREVRHRFNLERDLPIRFVLVRRATHEHTLVITAHHIAVDCWSLGLPFQSVRAPDEPWNPGILLTELLVTYRDGQLGRPSTLPILPIQFTDFAHWQNEQWRSGAFDRLRQFWLDRLRDAPRRIRLPVDHAAPRRYALTGARFEFEVPAPLAEALDRCRRARRMSLMPPLLAAYARALHEWSGEEDLVIGTPIGNRAQPETHHLIGPAANALALRLRLRGGSAAPLVEQARHVVEEALAHQDYPFARLVHDLDAADAPHPPVFQVRFALQHPTAPAFSVPSLSVTPLKIDRAVAKFDLSLVVAVHGSRLRAWCEYNTALFEAATIRAFADRFLRHAAERAEDR